MRSYVERMRPPRALYCDFPLGRPLGKPGDAAFQRSVLVTALALLARTDVPVLEDFPERIESKAEAPLACLVPPRDDDGRHPAVAEALGLRPAFERRAAAGGRGTYSGLDASAVPELLEALAAVDAGADPEGLDLRSAVLAVRSYYEESALALAGHVPAARQAEAWFYGSTEAGALLKRLQATLRARGADFDEWFYLVPLTQQEDLDGVPGSGA